ncbi:MAG TPA: aspartate--tRNA ligase, partial [Lentisphaeria bacterium]|nr:aspartate--tRNA ligase [Lentisphaeria bacterium]
YRTHTCNEINESEVGQQARISGWIHRVRDHGGVVFIDLRDHYGITQVVVDPERDFYEDVHHWRLESTVCFTGKIVRREEETVNATLATGKVELMADEMKVLNRAETLPFPVADETDYPEATRLRYRFLDLRRRQLHENIVLRSKITNSIRQRMIGLDFNEVQTPILTASSPEGARDFLVPSRLHPHKFYALPQAPQIFKQLLMVAGFDKYFQIAPCFRDEDSRADRSPGEFYQLDLEMSFCTQDDVFEVVETVMSGLFDEFTDDDTKVSTVPFERIPYRQAMLDFGCDKPDLRNPIRIIDVTEVFEDTEFKAFTSVVKKGGVVRAMKVTGIVDQSRKFFDDMIEFAQSVGSKGLGYIGWKDEEVRSPIAKFLNREQLEALKTAADIESGDVLFFIADKEKAACEIGAAVRNELGARLELLEPNAYRFCWIVDYPMFERDEATGKVEFSHNPFSMPQGEMEALETKDPLEVLAYQYDLVCNGIELSSGAIRNHKPEIMYKAFEIAGYDSSVVDNKFPGLITAFTLGAPPHGGIAPGLDRIVMLLTNQPNIREIIAFPMNQSAQDLMMNAPSEINERQLRELHIQLRPMKG